jgi:hypothetical protein
MPERSLAKWLEFGDALEQGKHIVAKQLRMNTPDSTSSVFNRAFKDWRAKNKFGNFDQAPGAKVTLSHLFWVMEHRGEVLAWFNALLPGARVRLNHPSSVYNRYRRDQRRLEAMAEDQDGEEPEKPEERQKRPLPPLAMSSNDDIAAAAFFDTYGPRADAVLRAILKERSRRRALKRGLPG